jgi:hypothetical protein
MRTLLIGVILAAVASAQWVNYPTPGLPRTQDGKPNLAAAPEPSFFGYSSGKWEGDTLVVQTVGFRDDSWADAGGSPLTASGKVTERFRRPNYGRLEIEITVDDPKAYTAPWTVKLNQRILLDSELLEFICVDNEKNRSHLVGK